LKPKNSSSVQLSGATVPATAEELPKFLNDEIPRIWAAIQALSVGHLDMTYAPPDKPRDGDIRYADGTTWNPGSGKGIYYYKSTTWTLLG
jgi:hypothetical protein